MPIALVVDLDALHRYKNLAQTMNREAPPELGSCSSLCVMAEETAGALNVSVPTLYTCVSRKNLRAHRLSVASSSRVPALGQATQGGWVSLGLLRDAAPGLTD